MLLFSKDTLSKFDSKDTYNIFIYKKSSSYELSIHHNILKKVYIYYFISEGLCDTEVWNNGC